MKFGVVSEATRGPVSATLKLEGGSLRFGDRKELLLNVEASSHAKLMAVEVPARVGHFRVRDHRVEKQSDSEWAVSMKVEAERSGRNVGKFPPILFDVISGEGAGQKLQLSLPAFEVVAEGLSEGDLPDLTALAAAPMELLTLPKRKSSPFLWPVVAALAVLVLFGLWWRMRPTKVAEVVIPVLSPKEEARAALNQLLASDLLSRGLIDRFYVELTGIVRRYIESTTGVKAPDQTTEEFLSQIANHSQFPADRRGALERFLEAADLVKYAAQIPDKKQTAESVFAARDFCELSEAEVPFGGALP
jgi:hypothetical protein